MTFKTKKPDRKNNNSDSFEEGKKKAQYDTDNPVQRAMKVENQSVDIDKNHYGFKMENGEVDLRLGNLTTEGWYWTGEGDEQMVGYLQRINKSKVRDHFLENMKNRNVTFNELKPYLKKSAEENDGLYELSGDNVRWHFGQTPSDDRQYEIAQEEIGDEDKIDEVFMEMESITYDEFEKEVGDRYKQEIEEAIEESNSYEEFWERLDELQQQYWNEAEEYEMEKFWKALEKVKQKYNL